MPVLRKYNQSTQQWEAISAGYAGSVGYTGSQGVQGNIGYTGSQGSIGYSGSKGDQGTVGFTGSKGDQGNVGYTGSKGDQGIGYTGSRGPTGYDGSVGLTGSKGDIGYTGSKGYDGSTGYGGSKGDVGGLYYKFSTTTTDADPGQGYIRYNNGTIGSVNTLFIDLADVNGTDLTTELDTWDDSTSTVKGQLFIRSNIAGDATYNVFQINSLTSASGYRKLGVTYLSGALPSNDESVSIIFVRTGDKGDIGYTGSAGYTGSQGATGYNGSVGLTGSKGDIGYTGSAGAGYTGSKGDVGGLNFKFSTTTTDADPGQGYLRYNNGTIGSVTTLFIDLTDVNAVDLTTEIDSWDDSTSTIKGKLLIRSNIGGDATYNIFQLNSITSASGYRKLGVTYISGALPSNDESISLVYVRTGDKGDIGYTGSAGAGYTGSQGAIGYTGSKGDQGTVGLTGSQGVQGNVGYTGSLGYTGSASTVQGPNGYNGSVGFTGSQGTIGYAGSQGTIGYTGSQGLGTSIYAYKNFGGAL